MKLFCSQCKKVITPEIPEGAQEVPCPECSAAVKVPENQLAPGAVIGDFLLEKPLSGGGMGMVYLARQISLDRPVALKVLHDKFSNNQEYIEGLFREARAAAKLTHPNIVQAYAVGEENGIFFFAMEYIRGETFKQILKRQNILDFDQAVKVIKEICGALQVAWNEQKLVHQDIKPDNIMLDSNGFAKLADLGLARSANSDAGPAEDENEVMGTPQYISPEQLTGVPTDVRSDIYSLGATFYQFVTGQFPYPEETAEAMARKHVEGNLTPPKEINPAVPQLLNDVIVKMMARHIEERYQSPADVIADLESYGKSTASVAVPKLSLNFNRPGAAGAAPGQAVRPGLKPGGSPLKPGMAPKTGAPAKPGMAPKNGAPAAPGASSAKAAPFSPQPPAQKAAPPAQKAAPPAPKAAPPAAQAAPAPQAKAAEPPPKAAAVPAPEAAPAPPNSQAEQAVPSAKPASKEEELTLAPKAPKPAAQPAEQKEGEGNAKNKENGKDKGADKAKDGKQEKGKGKERIARPSRNSWGLITYLVFLPVFLLVLAFVFYLLAQKGKLPEKLKGPGEKYAAAINSFLKIKKGETAAADAQQAQPQTQTAAPASPPKVVVKPAPVTRKDFIAGVKKLLDAYRSNPDKSQKFLEASDKFMAEYLPAVTKDEQKALAALKIAYAPVDELVRFAPARKKALEALRAREAKEKAEKEKQQHMQLAFEQSQRDLAAAQAKREAEQRKLAELTKAENDKRTRQLAEDFKGLYLKMVQGFYQSLEQKNPEAMNAALKAAADFLIPSSSTTPRELSMIAEFNNFRRFLPGACKELSGYLELMDKISPEYPRPPISVTVRNKMVPIIKVIPGKLVRFRDYSGKVGRVNMRSRKMRNEFFRALELSPLKGRRHIFYYELLEKKLSPEAMKQIKGTQWDKFIKLFSPELLLPGQTAPRKR